MTTNRVTWSKGEYGKKFRAPFNKSFQAALRREIPESERIFDFTRKEWWVSDAYLQEVKNLIFRYFTT